MKNLICSILALLCIATTSTMAQGPIDGYMKPEGIADFAVSYGHDHFTKYFLGNVAQDTFDRTYQSTSIFLAYGLDKNLNLIASVPFIWTDKDNKGIQDAQLFLKYRPLSKSGKYGTFDIITAAGVTTALSKYKISPESKNPIGERPTIVEGRVGVQQNFHNGFFIYAKSGISIKVSPNSQTIIPSLFKVGLAHAKFYTDFWLEYSATLNAKANEVPLGQEGSTFLKFGGTIYAPINQTFGAFVNAAYTPWGRNIGISTRLGAGFTVKF